MEQNEKEEVQEQLEQNEKEDALHL
jgi:hypothetical protein